MSIPSLNGSFYADPTGLTALKREAAAQTPAALRETAKQFESLFTTMMLKSMRQASPKDELFGSDQQDFYQSMFDQQLSVQLSKGKGLGLADVLVRQLMQGMEGAQGLPGLQSPPTAPGGSTGASNWPPRTRDEFVQAILPTARAVGQRLGIDPTNIVAQAALETGWGQSVPAGADGRPSFNLFGVKTGAAWTGPATNVATQEFVDGSMQTVDASFRAYSSPAESLHDYGDLLQSSPRYSAALGTGTNVEAFAQALQRGGYATDPDYANKLITVARELKSRFGQPISAGEA
jgi:flagellar protein FlgJ